MDQIDWGSAQERWSIAGGTAEGTSHQKTGQPCQDAIAWTCLVDGTLILAAADGAGSAAHSEAGAEAAVNAVVRVAPMLWSRTNVRSDIARTTRTLFLAARLSIQREASRRKIASRGFATTLTVAVVSLLEVCIGRVGDGLIAVQDSAGITTPMDHQEREYANEANFITDRDWRSCLEVAVLEARGLTGLALSSDGLRLVACSNPRTGAPFIPFYEDVFHAVKRGVEDPQLETFLKNVDDRTGDDKSLLVAVRGL